MALCVRKILCVRKCSQPSPRGENLCKRPAMIHQRWGVASLFLLSGSLRNSQSSPSELGGRCSNSARHRSIASAANSRVYSMNCLLLDGSNILEGFVAPLSKVQNEPRCEPKQSDRDKREEKRNAFPLDFLHGSGGQLKHARLQLNSCSFSYIFFPRLDADADVDSDADADADDDDDHHHNATRHCRPPSIHQH